MSTLRTDTLSNAAGSKSVPVNTVVDGSAKAWVNFNGTGTVAIRASFNVTSITDNGTGDYTVNFTSAMPNANYASVATGGNGSSLGVIGQSDHITARTTTAVRFFALNNTGAALVDHGTISVAIFR